MEEVLVYFRGGPVDGRVKSLLNDRGQWLWPLPADVHVRDYREDETLLPLPRVTAAVYLRTFPRQYESVITEDVCAKRGTRLCDLVTPCDWAVVFEWVGNW